MTDPRRRGRRSSDHRLQRLHDQQPGPRDHERDGPAEAMVDCGWGRLIFADTFDDSGRLAEVLRAEGPDRRDIAFYVRDPHVAIAAAPQELFLDPSHTYRLELPTYRAARTRRRGFTIRQLSSRSDAEAVNLLYSQRHMVPVPPEFYWADRDPRTITVYVAEDDDTGEIVGSVTGIDHPRATDGAVEGASLWCLAVAPQARAPGIGEALVRRLAEHVKARGLPWMDLSVMHDNAQAIALYEKLGFRRIPFFTVKRKNPINEQLFAGHPEQASLNPYVRIITDEARRRGIDVEVTDAEGGFFRLTYGGRSVRCRESLSEFTSAVAMSICDDKAVTRRVVERAGVQVPEQADAADSEAVAALLERHEQVVVKPARGEQGRGISVGLTTMEEIEAAVVEAARLSERVLVEEVASGADLRLIVIDYKVVAAAIRRPASVVGDGRTPIRELIEAQSRRRAAATGGESRIPVDDETERAVRAAGFGLDDVPEDGAEVTVRKTANLHTGGTIHDVTAETHPALIEAAVRAARAIEIPVTGIDLLVPDPSGPDYRFIEANERPGLANHEPQPTAERFIDLLFPLSIPQAARSAQRR